MNQERDFKGIWIPKEVWLNESLTLIEKVILVEIDSLDVDQKGCYANNNYFASFCNCSEKTITRAIKKLQDLGLLYQEYFNGRKRCIRSTLKITRTSIDKMSKQPRQIVQAAQTKCPGTNLINNINNNIINNKKESSKEKFTKPSIEEIELYCQERNNGIDPEQFYNFYESKGWMIGKNKMKDFRACIRTWEKRRHQETVPEWFDKNLQKEEATAEEQNEMQNFINNY